MNIPQRIAEMERQLKAAGSSVGALCERANIARSTWTRWKAGDVKPNWTTWEAVIAAADQLCPPPATKGAAA